MADMTDWYDDFISDENIDEKIVELTDLADKEKAPLPQEDIIELTDIVEDQGGVLELETPSDDTADLSKDPVEILEMDDPVDVVEVEPYAAEQPAQELSVTQEQLEAALERVIEKKFGDKIDILLNDGMEKVIKKEIIEIKEQLNKDLDLMGTV